MQINFDGTVEEFMQFFGPTIELMKAKGAAEPVGGGVTKAAEEPPKAKKKPGRKPGPKPKKAEKETEAEKAEADPDKDLEKKIFGNNI